MLCSASHKILNNLQCLRVRLHPCSFDLSPFAECRDSPVPTLAVSFSDQSLSQLEALKHSFKYFRLHLPPLKPDSDLESCG